ncbi:MAG: glycoside hydrolase family 32 protein [Chloroflexota bacterium]
MFPLLIWYILKNSSIHGHAGGFDALATLPLYSCTHSVFVVTLPYHLVTLPEMGLLRYIFLDFMVKKAVQAEKKSPQHDFSRPTYHYLPARNWMNDPNGVIQWNGRYHLFYQYNPFGAFHDYMHWGHAVSDDLIHWEELPIAIAPDPGTVDEGGIFSGCIVDHDGTPTAFYTGVNVGATEQRQCMATGDDELITWQKYAANPLIAAPPPHTDQMPDFRDPFVWRDDHTWYMVVGSRIAGVGGAALLYRSQDLQNWTYLHPLMVGDMPRHGAMWECPNFFPLGDKWVLVISLHTGSGTGNVIYFVGDFRDERFYPEYEGMLDSSVYYAPLTFLDEQNRRIMWGWLRESRSGDDQLAAGWSGVQAIPRVLTLDANNRLLMEPVPELEQIRAAKQHENIVLSDTPLDLPGLALDLSFAFRVESDVPCGFDLTWDDTAERIAVLYDPVLQTINVRHTHADNTLSPHGQLHRLVPEEHLELRILIDNSVLELIANRRTSITHRMYPKQVKNPRIQIHNTDAVVDFAIWEMRSIW